jgi:DNA repair protein RecN (Recombination protein N)
MIKFLRIRNLATIEEISLDLTAGFSILTGETGAGKSIIIDSIRLLCGEKASSELVRTGMPEASLEAIFVRPDVEEGADRSAPEEESGDLVVHRSIAGDGSGKAYCDGVLVPARKLKELSAPLVDIYGQNDHVFLLHLGSHLDYLDQFGGTLALREEVAAAARDLRRLIKQQAEWTAKEIERSRRLDFLEYQIKEIEKAGLKPGEEDELRARRNILKNSEKISSLVEQALEISYTGEAALSAQIGRLDRTLTDLTAFEPKFGEIRESLGSLGIAVQELADALMKFQERQGLGAESLEEVEERLSLIESLKRKYGSDIQDIRFYLEKIKAEHRDLALIQEKLAAVASEIEGTFSTCASKTGRLSQARKTAAALLEKLVEKEIALLGMKRALFHIRLDSVPADPRDPDRIKDTGLDEVEFLISPNPGEQLRPLRKIASGGELSRIMLALKAIGKDKGAAKTLIFDEIDSGIGGKTAECIAQKLKSLAKNHQILCITHLPQIASFAAHHYKIEKRIEGRRTFTTVQKLDFEGRVEEIARLMSGSRITAASLESAREILGHNAPESRSPERRLP